jgi:CheY-like chemotaxis protein/signal transduction histidine kinase
MSSALNPKAPHVLVVDNPQPALDLLEQLGLAYDQCAPDQVTETVLQARMEGRSYDCLYGQLPNEPAGSIKESHPWVRGLPRLQPGSGGWTLFLQDPHDAAAALTSLLGRRSRREQSAADTSQGPVLVVDDMPVNRKFLQGLLEQLERPSHQAASSEEALRLLAQHEYSVVLMDLELPDRDGLSTVRLLRSAPGPNQWTPVIAVSGHGEETQRSVCLANGIDDMVSKPVRRAVLAEKLQQWSGRKAIKPLPELPPEGMDAVDTTTLLEMTQGNAQLLAEVISLFAQDVQACLATLQRCLQSDDSDGFLACARALSGAAATLGASRLHQLAEQTRQAADTAERSRQLEALRAEARRVNEFLQTGLVQPEVTEVLLQAPLNLDDDQLLLVDLHSFLNMFNLVVSELFFLGRDLGQEELLAPCAAVIEELLGNLKQANLLASTLEQYDAYLERFWSLWKKTIEGHSEVDRVHSSEENLRSILAVARVRVKELQERLEHPDLWLPHRVADLRASFEQMFDAVQRNSKGRYQIVTNVAAKQSGDYLIHLDISSVEGDIIRMPAVLRDVFRDLVANARKYTEPGGVIQAGLVDDGSWLRIAVEDNGRGIPANEIPQVVEMGYRASNVADKPTMGGGFGLTKAYWTATRFGGRMTIRSGRDQGTRVVIAIPHPPSEISDAASVS